jgi:hypothetical protein
MNETLKYENPWGVMGGFSLGINAGPGVVLLDFHYAHDLGVRTYQMSAQSGSMTYTRNSFAISVGYRFGLIDKTDRSTEEPPPAEG